jgi:hypothetical protein
MDTAGEHAKKATERCGYELSAPLVVYRFDSVESLVEGWQTHVAVQRLIHEESARALQWLHYWVGGCAAVFASLAGSSAVIAWQQVGNSTGLAVLSAVIGIAASVLAGMATFLDLGGRAERHRAAAAAYKVVLRRLEKTPALEGKLTDMAERTRDQLTELEKTLSDLDASAPIPPKRRVSAVLARRRELRSAVPFGARSEEHRVAHPAGLVDGPGDQP